jgi:NADH:ubiquinone reductase (H+-translocating)
MNKRHVVIVGGGFAGVEITRRLLKHDAPVTITLISKNDTFEYYPGLYKLVTGAIPMEVSIPLRTLFPKKVTIVQGVYKTLDQKSKQVVLEDGHTITYDYVVLAMGSETNYFNIPGLPERSFSFKSVSEALRLKQHLCKLFTNAKEVSKEDMVARLHTVIVGGGPSGVELAGNLKAYLAEAAKEYSVDPSYITIDLIEAAPRILPALSEKVSGIAEKRLRQMGVNIFVNRALQSEDIEQITLKDMQMKTGTVIWTAGTRVNPAFGTTPGATLDEKKRVAISPLLTLSTTHEIFIAGDGAGTTYSGLAQTAMHDGKYIAYAIDALSRGRIVKAYRPKKPSFVIPIGTGWAMYIHNNTILTGVIPWILRSIIDFKYFTSTMSLGYACKVLEKGKRYRKSHTSCGLEEAQTR